jgi:hypothetical protein
MLIITSGTAAPTTKDSLMKRIRTTATIALLAVTLVACGGSDSDSTESNADASSDTLSAEQIAPFGEGEVAELRALMASFGAPVDETKCVAEALAGKVDKVKLKQMLDAADSGDADADIDVDTAVMFNDAVAECGLS